MPAGANTGSGEVEPEALASEVCCGLGCLRRFPLLWGADKMEPRSSTAARQFQFVAPFAAKGLTKSVTAFECIGFQHVCAAFIGFTAGIYHGSTSTNMIQKHLDFSDLAIPRQN